jgi:hypothetical protein
MLFLCIATRFDVGFFCKDNDTGRSLTNNNFQKVLLNIEIT